MIHRALCLLPAVVGARYIVHMKTRPLCQPALHSRMLVRPVIIHDHMDVQF
jgi:hypothetical protein